jgi:DNA-binding MarR family transcriptional regulator
MNEREEFIRCFREIHPKFSRLVSHYLTRANITMPQYALLNVVAVGKALPMSEVSKNLVISKPAVTHLVDRLERANYLKRLPHPKDRRSYLIQILPKGEKLIASMQMFCLGFFLETLKHFDAEEKKSVLRFYNLLSHTLDEVLAGQGKGKR